MFGHLNGPKWWSRRVKEIIKAMDRLQSSFSLEYFGLLKLIFIIDWHSNESLATRAFSTTTCNSRSIFSLFYLPFGPYDELNPFIQYNIQQQSKYRLTCWVSLERFSTFTFFLVRLFLVKISVLSSWPSDVWIETIAPATNHPSSNAPIHTERISFISAFDV